MLRYGEQLFCYRLEIKYFSTNVQQISENWIEGCIFWLQPWLQPDVAPPKTAGQTGRQRRPPTFKCAQPPLEILPVMWKRATQRQKTSQYPKVSRTRRVHWETATTDKNLEAQKMPAGSAVILSLSKEMVDARDEKSKGFEGPSALTGCHSARQHSYETGETGAGASWSLWMWLQPPRGVRGEIPLKQHKLGWNSKADEVL